MAFLLNIDFDAGRNTCYRRQVHEYGLSRTRSIPHRSLASSNWPTRTARESEHLLCVYRESKCRACVRKAHGARSVRLLSCRVCRAVGPASSRLRMISTTLSCCSDSIAGRMRRARVLPLSREREACRDLDQLTSGCKFCKN